MKELIDKRIAIKKEIKKLEETLKGIDEELWNECEPGEVLLGSEGHGYILKTGIKKEYGLDAVLKLPSSLLPSLVSLSTSSLERLAKKKLIPFALLDELPFTEKATKTIVEYYPEESKVL